MLTPPRTIREISHSSVLAEQRRLIAFPDRPLEKSGAEPLTPRHTWLNCRSAALLATTALVVVTAFAPSAARAQTWLPNPGTGDFNTATNWSPATVPTGTAFFGTSNTTALTFSAFTPVGGWTLNAGASAYTFANTQPLAFSGAGIVINGGSARIINDDTVAFNANSTAGSATITNNGDLNFNNHSTAGNAGIKLQ